MFNSQYDDQFVKVREQMLTLTFRVLLRDALYSMCTLILRFRRDPAYANQLQYDAFEAAYSAMPPSFVSECHNRLKVPPIPLDVRLFLEIMQVGTGTEHDPSTSELCHYFRSHQDAISQLAATRWATK